MDDLKDGAAIIGVMVPVRVESKDMCGRCSRGLGPKGEFTTRISDGWA